jgi:F-type H+-transporting ATPase subunit epsilon
MADNKVSFELVAPERLLFSAEVDMVVVPGSEGDFGVLPGHSPLISTVRAGVIDIYDGGIDPKFIRERIFVAGGFAEVNGSRCTVLAEEASPVRDIDMADLEARRTAARARLSAADTDDAKARINEEIARIEAMLAVGLLEAKR